MSHQDDVASQKTPEREGVAGTNLAPRADIVEKDPAKPEALSAETTLARENLAKEIIEYLSKEIETVQNGMMVFRSRISFAVLVGPFLILGTLVYAAKGLRISTDFSAYAWAAIGVVLFSYLALAFLSGLIEEDGWRQCNKWRKLISDLQKDPTIEINERNVRTDEHDVDPGPWMKWSYLIACALMLLAFSSLVFFLFQVNTTPIEEPPAPTSVSSPTQGAGSKTEK